MKRGRGRGRRSAELQHRTVWQGAAMLLARPDDRLPARLAAVEEMLGHLDGGYALALGRAGAGLRSLDLKTAILSYALTFESGGRRGLLLTNWMAEDNRDRVVYRQAFVDAYRAAGVPIPGGAMPDHLAVVLEFAAHADPDAGRRLLVAHRVPIAALHRVLDEAHSPYAYAVAAVCATLPEVAAEELHSLPISGPTTGTVEQPHVHLDTPPNGR